MLLPEVEDIYRSILSVLELSVPPWYTLQKINLSLCLIRTEFETMDEFEHEIESKISFEYQPKGIEIRVTEMTSKYKL